MIQTLGVASILFLLVAAPGDSAANPGDAPTRWGAHGHEIAARAAAAHLPGSIPAFFREAEAQLTWLNPEPDRWRDDDAPEMNEGFRYDHYVDLENLPHGALGAPDRWLFVEALYEGGMEIPHRDAGFLPYRIIELYQRLHNGFVRWRAEEDPEVRRWIQERIVNDAGILGHYVTDASNPHHTTIHFNGWDEAKVPNPGGFTTDRQFHARFEGRFVGAHIEYADVEAALIEEARVFEDVRTAVMAHIFEANTHVYRLYQLDRDVGFAPDAPPHPQAKAFAVERLEAGARMLRDLWWTAWVTSEAD